MKDLINQPLYLAAAAALAACLIFNPGDLQTMIWMLATLSTRTGSGAPAPASDNISDSGGDVTDPAGDPPSAAGGNG
ncbi:MAG: hypothetical protein QNK37_11740 [Acidobacteriota bacterium]|nr:hypothetical protein [Acidobacteriota bacterium]